jgi:predicted acetyltransferase
MPVEYRAITADEFGDLLEMDRIGFGQAPRKAGMPDSWARGELERTRVALDQGAIVGAGRNYSFELTVPGGALLPAAAVSWVSVLATHRRRGILTGVIDALHTDARERGEPVAMLTASESVIYGRFGYGIAAWRLGLSLERAHARFLREATDDGCVRFVEDDESLKLFPPVYDVARRQRHGMVTRPDFWWPEVMHWLADEYSPTFRVVHEDRDGVVDGFAMYGLKGEWERGISTRKLLVVDLQSTNSQAREALWRFLIGVDLVHTISAGNVPVDEPLRLMLADPRRVRVDYVNDGLWLCVLDEAATLRARSYGRNDRIVLEVHRPDGSTGTFELDGGSTGATCNATSSSADIVLGTAQLGAAYLGGVTFTELHDAGLIDEVSPGAIARADAMFATVPAPAMTTGF